MLSAWLQMSAANCLDETVVPSTALPLRICSKSSRLTLSSPNAVISSALKRAAATPKMRGLRRLRTMPGSRAAIEVPRVFQQPVQFRISPFRNIDCDDPAEQSVLKVVAIEKLSTAEDQPATKPGDHMHSWRR